MGAQSAMAVIIIARIAYYVRARSKQKPFLIIKEASNWQRKALRNCFA